MEKEPEVPHFSEVETVPPELDAKTYTVDGVHVFISYKAEGGIPIIYNVVLHSNNLSLSRELSAMSSLLSLIFRSKVPYGIVIRELRSINDEFYNKIADVIQTFLSEFGIMEAPREKPVKQESILTFTLSVEEKKVEDVEEDKLAVCPVCGKRTLVVENGCYTCINPECGWSKCEL